MWGRPNRCWPTCCAEAEGAGQLWERALVARRPRQWKACAALRGGAISLPPKLLNCPPWRPLHPANALPVSFLQIPNAGHPCYLDDPALFNRELLRFLENEIGA